MYRKIYLHKGNHYEMHAYDSFRYVKTTSVDIKFVTYLYDYGITKLFCSTTFIEKL